MKHFLYIIGVLILLIFQAGVMVPVGIRDAGNLVLVFAIIAVLHEDFRFNIFAVLTAGLILDFVSGTIDGTNILSLFAIYGFTNILIYRFVPKEQTWLIFLVIVTANTILFSLSLYLFGNLFAKMNLNQTLDPGYLFGTKIIKDLIVNLVVVYPIYWLYKFLVKERKIVFT